MDEITRPQPQKEHEWLQKLVGEWTWEHEATAEPGKPAEKIAGTETVRSIDGIWTLGEGRSSTRDGGTMTSIMTLGYDPAKKRFVGTFIASMMTSLWVYEGVLDATGNALVLDTEGPNFSEPGTTAMYKDTIRFESDDHRILTSTFQNADGSWTDFMTAHYWRKTGK